MLTGGINLSGPPPMDVINGSTWTCCYGIAALTQKWFNQKPLIDFIVGTKTYTLKTVNGYPDVKFLATMLGVTPTLGIKGALISKWYDQSGNSNDAPQATTANQPAIWMINGEVCVFFGGILSTDAQALSPQFLNIPSAATFNSQSFSAFAVVNPYTSVSATAANGFKFSTIFSSASSAGNGFIFNCSSTWNSGATPYGQVIDLLNFAGGAPNQAINQKSIMYAFGTASSMSMGYNETIDTEPGAGASTTVSGGILGGVPSFVTTFYPYAFSGRMYCFMATSTQFNTTQTTLLKNALYQWGKVIPNIPAVNIVFDGASFDQGQGGDACGLYGTQNGGGYGYFEMVKDQLSNRAIQLSNVACSGNNIVNCTTNYPLVTTGLFNSSSTKNIIVGPNSAAGNSINGGKTGAQAYIDFQAWLAAVKADAWSDILCILYSANPGTEFQNFNNLMIANAAINGVTMIDMTAQQPAGPGLPWLWPDGHPTILGHQSIFGEVMPYILQALEAP